MGAIAVELARLVAKMVECELANIWPEVRVCGRERMKPDSQNLTEIREKEIEREGKKRKRNKTHRHRGAHTQKIVSSEIT